MGLSLREMPTNTAGLKIGTALRCSLGAQDPALNFIPADLGGAHTVGRNGFEDRVSLQSQEAVFNAKKTSGTLNVPLTEGKDSAAKGMSGSHDF